MKEKGGKRPFIACRCVMLLNLRWVTECFIQSLNAALNGLPLDDKGEYQDQELSVNLEGQLQRTGESFKAATWELQLRDVIVPRDNEETLRRCEAYDLKHWGDSA